MNYQELNFQEIKGYVKSLAISDYAKKEIDKREPSSSLDIVEKRLLETVEACYLLDSGLYMPFMGLTNIEHLTQKIKKGLLLEPNELVDYADFLRSARLISSFLNKHVDRVPTLCRYANGLGSFCHIEEVIYDKIRHNQVDDDASRELRKTRRALLLNDEEIRQRLKKFLKDARYKEKIQEFIVVEKDTHYTIPIKSSFKNQVPGIVIDESYKGLTTFIEPNSVVGLTQERALLKATEIAQVYEILAELTELIAQDLDSIYQTIEIIVEFDVIFARAKYSKQIDGKSVMVNKEEYIRFCQVRHPLLKQAVPLSLEIGRQHRALMITGPNAGGKTVVLKTIGLITVMVMFGLLVPCEDGTQIAIMDDIYVNIGDNQNLENALSTFSSHVRDLAFYLKDAKRHTLVLLDEIGSGTEPNDGAALGIAILSEFYQKGSLIVATTHYGELKEFALQHPDFQTAAMLFEKDTLKPTYQLQMGQTGKSHAFFIASQMGIAEIVLQKARQVLTHHIYPLEQVVFESLKQKQKRIHDITYEKGDKVWIQTLKKEALIYEVDMYQQCATVYFDKQMHTIPLKKIKLVLPAKQLYPVGYNMALLFTEYAIYKQQKDLNRGSKKAWKKYRKEKEKRGN
ncbi:endonuclease MutS2 [Carnobacteriaceae bacterium zg-84]|uniref:endonuclease MutS2 n=1 Tax=Granulicatella sp. zg-84 TaxID=2678503 RepID=UPI0013BFFFA3|nr:endonuclease MutS2 [Granulicatella sp. zg-84]NEW66833.1 endonuclease MutS2 [Granulicatella sp. zg-84]QMI86227.1 endonuclease MutS2 [Carnobacteriaceae bacterium zg-84]